MYFHNKIKGEEASKIFLSFFEFGKPLPAKVKHSVNPIWHQCFLSPVYMWSTEFSSVLSNETRGISLSFQKHIPNGLAPSLAWISLG